MICFVAIFVYPFLGLIVQVGAEYDFPSLNDLIFTADGELPKSDM